MMVHCTKDISLKTTVSARRVPNFFDEATSEGHGTRCLQWARIMGHGTGTLTIHPDDLFIRHQDTTPLMYAAGVGLKASVLEIRCW